MRTLPLVAAAVAAGALLVGTMSAAAAETPSRTPLADAVAANLGVTPEKLRAALQAALVARIDAAAAAGRLTPDQAATLKAGLANAQKLIASGALADRAKALRERLTATMAKQLGPAAALLKLTPAQVRAELKAGKSLTEIAATQGVSRQALLSGLTAPAKAQLAKAVAAGRLTQARADQIAQQLTGRLARLVDLKRPQA